MRARKERTSQQQDVLRGDPTLPVCTSSPRALGRAEPHRGSCEGETMRSVGENGRRGSEQQDTHGLWRGRSVSRRTAHRGLGQRGRGCGRVAAPPRPTRPCRLANAAETAMDFARCCAVAARVAPIDRRRPGAVSSAITSTIRSRSCSVAQRLAALATATIGCAQPPYPPSLLAAKRPQPRRSAIVEAPL